MRAPCMIRTKETSIRSLVCCCTFCGFKKYANPSLDALRRKSTRCCIHRKSAQFTALLLLPFITRLSNAGFHLASNVVPDLQSDTDPSDNDEESPSLFADQGSAEQRRLYAAPSAALRGTIVAAHHHRELVACARISAAP